MSGECSAPADRAHRLVLVITPGNRTDKIELGTHDSGLFHGTAEIDGGKPRRDPATTADVYSWQTTRGEARLELVRIRQTGVLGDAEIDLNQHSFTYTRPVTVGGATDTAVSTGTCFDPTNVLLGPSLVPGIIRDDENERYFAIPENRQTLVAHCSLALDGAPAGSPPFDLWLQADWDNMVCRREPASDGIECFDRRTVGTDTVFSDTGDPATDRFTIRKDGAAVWTEPAYDMGTGPKSEERRYTGSCELGPAF